ncbi:LOW QUALITY PROTEIN: cytochrome P450 71B26-like [Argentina anserina]|uniref:LOW QUALITY PROTEIN: cytochrome P450 71B26-like n=1 Tax=Argentina anserina TaxID=57926 RepID=UPI0021765C75|nr:LOW QUALITY PROTEIN: cytochrome P450 71B26-like [Potentilla anserina]
MFGPVMLLHLGRIPTLIISSAEAAKQVMKDNDIKCCSRPSSFGSRKLTFNYLDMCFAPYGEYWREIRKICVLELFSVKRVQSYQEIREEEVAKMIASISKESPSSSSCVDLTEKLYAAMGSMAFRVILGTSFEGSTFEHHRFHHVLHETEIMLAGFSAADYFPSKIGYFIDRISGKHKQFEERVSRELHGFFQRVIDDHLKPGRTQQEHDDIVGVLLKIVKEQTGLGSAHLGHDNIKALLVNFFLGGIDTGASTVIWAMAELAKKPRLMKKAQDEMRSCVRNIGKVSESTTEQLPYLKMIVKETLRLHPPTALMAPRESIAPFKVLGYDVEPKTQVIINDWVISRDPEFWKDPEEFIPERFDDSSVDFKGQHFQFLPFGAGRRICPGIYMATTTVELVLANLLYCFDWKLPEGMKEDDINMEETTGELALTVSKKTALNLVPVRFST